MATKVAGLPRFDRIPEGWSLTVRDGDGNVRRFRADIGRPWSVSHDGRYVRVPALPLDGAPGIGWWDVPVATAADAVEESVRDDGDASMEDAGLRIEAPSNLEPLYRLLGRVDWT